MTITKLYDTAEAIKKEHGIQAEILDATEKDGSIIVTYADGTTYRYTFDGQWNWKKVK